MKIVNQKSTRLFIILAMIFIANAIIAEIIGVKIFSLEPTLGLASLDWNLFDVYLWRYFMANCFYYNGYFE